MEKTEIEKLLRKYILIISLIVLAIIYFSNLLGFLGTLWLAFSNIVFAAMFAYVVNIVMSRIERLFGKIQHPIIKKLKRPISLLLSLALLGLIIYALINLVFPVIADAIGILINALPIYFTKTQDYLTNLFKNNPEILPLINHLEIDWKNLLENAISMLGNGLGNVVGTTINLIGTIAGSLFNILLVVIFAIYILFEKERFGNMYQRLAKLFLKPRIKEELDVTLKIVHQSFSSFIAGQCLEAVILGSLCTLGMVLLQMPYPLMVGTLVGTINIIPIVGAYVGGAIGMFMVFTVDPMLSLGFLVYLIILQQFESNVIYPRVVGNSVGLPGIYVLASVMVFGSLAGIPGMFLGIPTVASIYKLTKRYIAKKEAQVESV